jgi:hypothetical protein
MPNTVQASAMIDLVSFILYFYLVSQCLDSDGDLLTSDYTPPRLKIAAMSQSDITIS